MLFTWKFWIVWQVSYLSILNTSLPSFSINFSWICLLCCSSSCVLDKIITFDLIIFVSHLSQFHYLNCLVSLSSVNIINVITSLPLPNRSSNDIIKRCSREMIPTRQRDTSRKKNWTNDLGYQILSPSSNHRLTIFLKFSEPSLFSSIPYFTNKSLKYKIANCLNVKELTELTELTTLLTLSFLFIWEFKIKR